MRNPAPDALTTNTSLVIGALVGALHYAVFHLVYQYAEIYDEFGGELPAITRMLIESPIYYWIFPVLVTIALLVHHAGYLSRSFVLLFSSIGSGISTALCVLGLYLPILQLGSVVSP